MLPLHYALIAVNAGDTIQFKCSGDVVSCRVTQKHVYKSFREMLEEIGIEKCLPTAIDIADGVEIYRSFPNYIKLEKNHGVVAFTLELL